MKQIERLSKLNDILKKNDSITLAYEILSKNNNKNLSINAYNYDLNSDSIKLRQNNIKIEKILKNLKNLLK